MNTEQPSDETLVIQFRNGDVAAGSFLYSRHKNGIFSFCMSMTGDRDAAGDATQETFLKMLTGIQSLKHGSAFKSWLFSVARNEILTVLRRKKIVPMERLEDDHAVFDASSPLAVTIHSELRERLHAAIGRLKPAYRETYLLREIEGLSYEQIATATGTSVSAVKSKLFKSRVALNEMLFELRRDL